MKSYWKLEKNHRNEFSYSKEKMSQKIENEKTPEKREKTKKREQEIDLMNVFLCLLVVFIHVVSEAVSHLRIESWQFFITYVPQKLASFVVYGFIFLNAIKLFRKDTEKVDFVNYYKGRIRKIIVPYLISVIIYDLYFIHKGYFAFSITELFHNMVTGDLVAHFYFMIIIIQFYLLFPILRKLVRKIHPAVGITIAFLITFLFTKYLPSWLPNFPYHDRLFTPYFFYWIVGAYIGLFYEKIRTFLLKPSIMVCLSILYVLTAVAYIKINYQFLRFNQFLNWLDGIQILYHSISILFLLAICISLANKEKLYKVVSPINQVTYPIYLYHVLVIFLVNEQLEHFKITNLGERLAIRFVLVYSILLVYSLGKEKMQKVKKRYWLTS